MAYITDDYTVFYNEKITKTKIIGNLIILLGVIVFYL